MYSQVTLEIVPKDIHHTRCLFSGYHDCFVYFQIKGSSVNYLLDQVTLAMVPNNPNWRTEAQSRIEQIRKADITIT